MEETILSVYHQDYKNFEHFIVDGGSTDNSVEIIKKHSSKINWWVSEKDKGQTNAINKGLKKANGDIVMWLNSDDVLLPGALKKAEHLFKKNPNAIMVHGKSVLYGAGKKEQIIGKKQKDLKLKYLAYIPFPQPSSFFRKKLIDETGLLDETLHYGMDYELLVRAALNYEIVFADELFSRYRLHDESKTNHSLKFCKDWNLVFSRVLNSFEFSEPLKKKFADLGFSEDKTHKYKVNNKFSFHNIEKAFLYHLQIMMHFQYSEMRLEKAKQIAKEIKAISPAFYKQQKVGIINFRSSFLNKYLITLMRNFTRR
ncbi:MAG: glycosyltransferase [Bacteroidia bacterium]|nr:glycosyltransferase [Bacteroidia bacterium]